jgi:hypothetical protein
MKNLSVSAEARNGWNIILAESARIPDSVTAPVSFVRSATPQKPPKSHVVSGLRSSRKPAEKGALTKKERICQQQAMFTSPTYAMLETHSDKGDARFQRLCPLLSSAIHGRRYVLPGYRQSDYESQEVLNTVFERTLVGNALSTVTKNADVQFDNLVGALCYGRPILFLERELGEAFVRRQLPSDLHVTDVRWKWPQLRLMVPLNLCTIRRDGTSRSLAYLDVCLLDKDIRLPERFEAELEDYVRRVAPAVYADPRRRKINQLCYRGDQPCLCLGAATDGPQPATYIWLSAWSEHTLEALVKNEDAVLHTECKVDDTDEDFLRRVRHLTLSILLYLSAVPIEYEPVVLRKERQEGHHLKPALLRARFVGSSQIRPIRVHVRRSDHQPGEQHRAAHVTSGHWNANFAVHTGASAG